MSELAFSEKDLSTLSEKVFQQLKLYKIDSDERSPITFDSIFSNRIFDLAERITRRVEESLKHQADILEKTLHQMDKRFEQVDRRFSMLQWFMGLGFTVITVMMPLYNFLAQ